MSDPRYTDPRYNDPWNRNAVWSNDPFSKAGRWALGLCLMVLIAAIIIVGMYLKPGRNTASNNRAPITTHGMPMTSPDVTGSGSTSPQPPMPPSQQ